jgi:hypothetical protein
MWQRQKNASFRCTTDTYDGKDQIVHGVFDCIAHAEGACRTYEILSSQSLLADKANKRTDRKTYRTR